MIGVFGRENIRVRLLPVELVTGASITSRSGPGSADVSEINPAVAFLPKNSD